MLSEKRAPAGCACASALDIFSVQVDSGAWMLLNSHEGIWVVGSGAPHLGEGTCRTYGSCWLCDGNVRTG